MQGFFSNYLINKLLDHVFGATPYAAPSPIFAAIMLTAPTPASAGSGECVGAGYSRLSITNDTTNYPAAVSQIKSNGTLWNWGTPPADWGDAVGIALFDQAAGGNLLGWAPFTTGVRTIRAGQPFQVLQNGWTATILTECTA